MKNIVKKGRNAHYRGREGGGSCVAKWLKCSTRNPAVLGSSRSLVGVSFGKTLQSPKPSTGEKQERHE